MGVFATLNEDKEKWYIVWPFYSTIFGAMALYVFHDVIDDRWRRRTSSYLWFFAYLFLNLIFIPACALYFALQLTGGTLDHREAAATMIAVFVNFFTFRKVIRGFMAFEVTAVLAQRFALARPPQRWRTGQISRYTEYVGDLVEKNASCLFDDDVPGNSARIAWLKLIWLMLSRWLQLEYLCIAPGRLTKIRPSWGLQDANDLIIMVTAWLWGSLSQVPAPKGEVRGKFEAANEAQVPHIAQLWHLVHVLDRAAVLNFLYAHSVQLPDFNIEYRYTKNGPTMPLVVSTASATAAGDYDPGRYRSFTGKESQEDSDGGLLQLRKAFPGAMKVLDICFLWHTQDALVEKRYESNPSKMSDPNALKPPCVERCDYPDARRSRSYRFMKAAAVNLSVHFLFAAVRRWFSFGCMSTAQVHSRLTPEEHMLASAAVEDAERVDLGDELDQRHVAGCLPCTGATSRNSRRLSNFELWRLHHHIMKICISNSASNDPKVLHGESSKAPKVHGKSHGDTEREALEKQLMIPDQALELFKTFELNQTALPRAQAKGLPPFLIAYACSIISLIVSASTGIRAEVNEKVAKLPAMERDAHVGNARLSLIGITDYMYGSSLYIHQRTVPALLLPEGPLCKGEDEALHKLLRFFQRLPEALFKDSLHESQMICNPDNPEVMEAATQDHSTAFDYANASLAMASAFASIMATAGTCGHFKWEFATPDPTKAKKDRTSRQTHAGIGHSAPTHSPRLSTNPQADINSRAAYHHQTLLALYHAVCTAWDWLALNGKDGQKPPQAGSEVAKVWGILQLSGIPAANAAADASDSRGHAQAPSRATAGPSKPNHTLDAPILMSTNVACAHAAAAAVFTSQALSVAKADVGEEDSRTEASQDQEAEASHDQEAEAPHDQEAEAPQGPCVRAQNEVEHALERVANSVTLLLLVVAVVMIFREEKCNNMSGAEDERLLECMRTAAQQSQAYLSEVNLPEWPCVTVLRLNLRSTAQAVVSKSQEIGLKEVPKDRVPDHWWSADGSELNHVFDTLSSELKKLHQALEGTVQESAQRQNSVGYLAKPLVAVLNKSFNSQLESTEALASSSTQAPPQRRGGSPVRHLDIADLVNASQAVVAWAAACKHSCDRKQAEFPIFWAAYLHIVMAREAFNGQVTRHAWLTDTKMHMGMHALDNAEKHAFLDNYADIPSIQSERSMENLRTLMANMADEVGYVAEAQESGFPNRWMFKQAVQTNAVVQWTDCCNRFENRHKMGIFVSEFASTSTPAAIMCEKAAQELLYVTRTPGNDLSPEDLIRFREKALHHSVNAAEIASMLVQVAVQKPAHASLKSYRSASCGSDIAQQLSPAAAAKVLGAISQVSAVSFCQRDISSGESARAISSRESMYEAGYRARGFSRSRFCYRCQTAVGAASMHDSSDCPTPIEAADEDSDEAKLTESETALQQELHGAGVVVGVRLWQLFRRLLRDRELMDLYRGSGTARLRDRNDSPS